MSNKKHGLDKTSMIMIAVFFGLIVLFAAAFLIFYDFPSEAPKAEEQVTDVYDSTDKIMDNLTDEQIKTMFPDAQPGSTYTYVDDEGNFKTVTIPGDYKAADKAASAKDVVAASKYKFENYTDLTDKFMEVCKAGDVKELYHLYYGDFFDGMRLNMEQVQTTQEFEAGIRSNMLSVTGFEEYEYGSMELPPSQSPASYAAFIFSQVNGGKTLPLSPDDIEDCVNLVVYINNMYQTNHFMAKIHGYWYFIA